MIFINRMFFIRYTEGALLAEATESSGIQHQTAVFLSFGNEIKPSQSTHAAHCTVPVQAVSSTTMPNAMR